MGLLFDKKVKVTCTLLNFESNLVEQFVAAIKNSQFPQLVVTR